MNTQQQPTGVFSAMSVTLQNLLGSVNTAANLINRTVNAADQGMQMLERTASTANTKHKLVSLKEIEQYEAQYKLLDEDQKKLLEEQFG